MRQTVTTWTSFLRQAIPLLTSNLQNINFAIISMQPTFLLIKWEHMSSDRSPSTNPVLRLTQEWWRWINLMNKISTPITQVSLALNIGIYELITSLPSYPKPSVDYNYLLGYIPYPSWTYQCRSSSSYNLYIATDHLLFKTASKSLSITASITIPCIMVLVILFRIYFIIRHVIDLKSRKTYNAMMLT